ncbi:hypothetical protein DL771_003344 [Monosporascus sp. 5C6A]|nr:hypothetical protein DL771_003344 [Monosporascus sp. 5C6A]
MRNQMATTSSATPTTAPATMPPMTPPPNAFDELGPGVSTISEATDIADVEVEDEVGSESVEVDAVAVPINCVGLKDSETADGWAALRDWPTFSGGKTCLSSRQHHVAALFVQFIVLPSVEHVASTVQHVPSWSQQ